MADEAVVVQGKATGTAITRDALIAAFDLPTARARPELYCAVADVVQVSAGPFEPRQPSPPHPPPLLSPRRYGFLSWSLRI